MITIAINGASGQVGTELCLFLSQMPDVRVIAICRSRLSSALLQRCDIECRIGVLDTIDGAKLLLSGCDLLFDLALPRGTSSEVRRSNLRIIENSLAVAPEKCKYVFASTYMALGMPVGERLAHHLISKTSYGAHKRKMEAVSLALGRKFHKQVYVLRLGEVHGEMQNVSRILLSSITDETTFVPSGPSNTVFVFTIAEALISIAQGKEATGLYMMTSSPQWSWSDLYQYFAHRSGRSPEIIETTAHPMHRRSSWLTIIKSSAAKFLLRHRELVTGYIFSKMPAIERRAKAVHLMKSARAQIADIQRAGLRPFDSANYGHAPGRRISGVSDSRQTMPAHAAKVREKLGSLT